MGRSVSTEISPGHKELDLKLSLKVAVRKSQKQKQLSYIPVYTPCLKKKKKKDFKAKNILDIRKIFKDYWDYIKTKNRNKTFIHMKSNKC